MRARRAPLICLLVLALGLGACGGDDREGSVEESGGTTTAGETATTGTTGTTPAPSGPATETVKVEESEFRIDPENPRIAKTGVVSFEVRNTGKVPHALEVEGPEGEVETDTIGPGKRATLKANLSRPGTYKWYCPVRDHEDRGMTGKVSVAGGGSRTGSDDSRGGGGGGKGSDSGKRPGAGGGNSGGVY